MSGFDCSEPLALDILTAYWLGELDDGEQDRVERHLFDCSACSSALAEVAGLAAGIRTAARHGRPRTFVGSAFPRRLARAGLRVREYRVACNGSVNCTVAPDDDVVVARLEAALAGIDRVDLVLFGADDGAQRRLEDVPFDAAAGEVVMTPDVAELRALPVTTQRMRLVAVEHGRDRLIGDYTFHHTPWPGARS